MSAVVATAHRFGRDIPCNLVQIAWDIKDPRGSSIAAVNREGNDEEGNLGDGQQSGGAGVIGFDTNTNGDGSVVKQADRVAGYAIHSSCATNPTPPAMAPGMSRGTGIWPA